MRRFLIGTFLTIGILMAHAQEGPFGVFEDALRFSQSDYTLGSTARMQGIGGAQISLGGDISSAVSNPAGLGFFNKSIFTISPSLNFTNARTDFFIDREGQSLQGDQENFSNNFNIANVGAVINWNKGRFSNDKFKGGSLAISVHRANNYRLTRSYSGDNDFNSVVDFIANNQGTVPDSVLVNENSSTLGSFAYNNFLISPVFNASDELVGYAADFEGNPFQSEQIVETGSHYQMNVAWGGNYDDRLYFGAGTGFQFLNYSRSRNYQESDFRIETAPGTFEPDPKIDELFLDEEFSSRGLGINFNAGIIARPVPFMTIGVSYTSPSFMTFDEEGFEDLEFYWRPGATTVDGGETISLDGLDGVYQSPLAVPSYNLRTPSRVGLGATLFVGKSGFLSGDVEFVDYSNATINSNDFSARADNQIIEDIYTSVMNVRVGGEYRIENFRLRAGYALLPSPYQDSDLNEQTSLSFGIGYRNADYFLDLAIVNRNRNIEYIPYESPFGAQPVAQSEIENTTVTVTWGINF